MRRIVLLPLLGALATGCTLGGMTHGEKGNATFSYAFCMNDCGMSASMMHGTSEAISVRAPVLPAVTVTSTAPNVVSIANANPTRQCCSTTLGVESCHPMTSDTCASNEHASLALDVAAVGPGDAELVLTRGDGTVFDQVAVSVAEPASIELEGAKGNAITLTRGTNLAAGWKARDASGNELMATSGVQLSTSDASVVDFQSTWLSSHSGAIDAVQILSTIDPIAAGDAIITVKAQSVTTTMLAHVR